MHDLSTCANDLLSNRATCSTVVKGESGQVKLATYTRIWADYMLLIVLLVLVVIVVIVVIVLVLL